MMKMIVSFIRNGIIIIAVFLKFCFVIYRSTGSKVGGKWDGEKLGENRMETVEKWGSGACVAR